MDRQIDVDTVRHIFTFKMLKNNNVIFEISSLNIPNISSSMIRLNNNYSDLPESLIDIVKKNNLYKSIR